LGIGWDQGGGTFGGKKTLTKTSCSVSKETGKPDGYDGWEIQWGWQEKRCEKRFGVKKTNTSVEGKGGDDPTEA